MRSDWKIIFGIFIGFYLLTIIGCVRVYQLKTPHEIENATIDINPLPDSLFTLPDENNVKDKDEVIIALVVATDSVYAYYVTVKGELGIQQFGKPDNRISLDNDDMIKIRNLLLELNSYRLFSLTETKINAITYNARTICCLSLFCIGDWLSKTSVENEDYGHSKFIGIETKNFQWKLHFKTYHMKYIPVLQKSYNMLLEFFNDKLSTGKH